MNDLQGIFARWKLWSESADQTEEGWESDFPEWDKLMDAALATIVEATFGDATAATISECFSISEEGEDLLGRIRARGREAVRGLALLADSERPSCRWQVYEALGDLKDCSLAESLLRRGLADEDNYARRRAILALSRLSPVDARDLVARFIGDSDPYIRQASIELIITTGSSTYAQGALARLLTDPVDHVRHAAEAALGRLS